MSDLARSGRREPPRPFPVVHGVPELSRSQMVEVDRLMIEDYRIGLVQMMENAGRALAIVARDVFLEGTAAGRTVAVLAGSGGNGGGALAAARRLAIWGAEVSVGLSRPANDLTPVPRLQHDILNRIARPAVFDPAELPDCDLLVDGLVGYSLRGAPRGRTAAFVSAVNASRRKVLSLDVPSGYDAATGKALDPTVLAAATLTLALPKTGMTQRTGRATVGRLFCADISVPPGLYRSVGLTGSDLAIFSYGDIVEVDTDR